MWGLTCTEIKPLLQVALFNCPESIQKTITKSGQAFTQYKKTENASKTTTIEQNKVKGEEN